jgi:hypothetical protein
MVLKTKLVRSPLFVVRYKYQQFLARLGTYQAYWSRVLREIEEGTYRRGATTQAERQASQRAEAAIRRAQGAEVGPELNDDAPIEEKRVHHTAKSAEAFLAQLLGKALPPEDKPPAPPRAASVPTVEVKPVVVPPVVVPAVVVPPVVVPAVRAAAPKAPPPEPSPVAPPRPQAPPPMPMAPPPLPPEPKAPRSTVAPLFDEYMDARRARGEDVSKLSLASFEKSVERQREQARAQLGADVELKVKVKDDKVTVIAVKKKT